MEIKSKELPKDADHNFKILEIQYLFKFLDKIRFLILWY